MRKPSKLAEPRLSLRGGGGKLQGVSGYTCKSLQPDRSQARKRKETIPRYRPRCSHRRAAPSYSIQGRSSLCCFHGGKGSWRKREVVRILEQRKRDESLPFLNSSPFPLLPFLAANEEHRTTNKSGPSHFIEIAQNCMSHPPLSLHRFLPTNLTPCVAKEAANRWKKSVNCSYIFG